MATNGVCRPAGRVGKTVAGLALGVVASLAASGWSAGHGPATAADFEFEAAPMFSGVTIGTGSISGVYYYAGRAICVGYAEGAASDDGGCQAELSPGSTANIRKLRNGAYRYAIVQSDVEAAALRGSGPFADDGAYADIRVAASLHPELFTVIARAGDGIETLEDLRDKRLDVGRSDSGYRATLDAVLGELGWPSDATRVESRAFRPRITGLCGGDVDGVIHVIGHPNHAFLDATNVCDLALVSADSEAVRRVVDSRGDLVVGMIPGGIYRGNPNPTATFGVTARLLTDAREPAESVYRMLTLMFENFDALAAAHPVLSRLKRSDLIPDQSIAPLHPGARRFYQERGYLE